MDLIWCSKEEQDEFLGRMSVYDKNFVFAVGNNIYFQDYVSKFSINRLILLIENSIKNSISTWELGKTIDINIHIDSTGGSSRAMFKFVDFINVVNNKYENINFNSIVNNIAGSAASLMAMSCPNRMITENAEIFVHDMFATIRLNITEIEARYEHLVRVKEKLSKIYEKNSNIDALKWIDIMKDNKYFSAEEALENGLVDKII